MYIHPCVSNCINFFKHKSFDDYPINYFLSMHFFGRSRGSKLLTSVYKFLMLFRFHHPPRAGVATTSMYHHHGTWVWGAVTCPIMTTREAPLNYTRNPLTLVVPLEGTLISPHILTLETGKNLSSTSSVNVSYPKALKIVSLWQNHIRWGGMLCSG